MTSWCCSSHRGRPFRFLGLVVRRWQHGRCRCLSGGRCIAWLQWSPGQCGRGQLGAAYVFNRTGGGGTWSQRAYLKSPNADAGDGLGIGISLSRDGSTLAVAADFEDSGAAGLQGNQADSGTSMLAPSTFTICSRARGLCRVAAAKAPWTGLRPSIICWLARPRAARKGQTGRIFRLPD